MASYDSTTKESVMADSSNAPGVPIAPNEDPYKAGGTADPSIGEAVASEFNAPSIRGPLGTGLRPPEATVEGGRIEPTPEEIRREVGYGTAIGGIQGGSTMAGATWGLRAGLAAAPFLGPFAPFAPVVGTVGGATIGYLLSKDVDSLFPAVAREDLVPYREGGKTFGGTIAAAPFAFGLPVMQGGRVANFISRIGESARKYPKSYLVGETISGVGAGTFGGAAVEYAPDSPGTRVMAEMVGGMLSPGRFVSNATGSAKDFLGTMIRSTSSDARQARAANRLYSILEETGEDIPALIRRLEANLPTGVNTTAAQKTGSATLGVLETTLARSNPRYAAEIRKQGLDSIRAYELLIENLNTVGTPEAFREAAKLRQDKFTKLLQGRLEAAEIDAAEKISRITRDTPAARVEIGRIVQQSTEDALRDARLYEKLLWTDAYRDTLRRKTVKGETSLVPRNVIPENTGRSALEIATSMSPERFNSLPTEVRQIMGRLGVDQEAISRFAAGRRTQEFVDTGVMPSEYLTRPAGPRTTKRESVFNRTDVEDLINIRSDLLDFARNASVRGEVANSGFYSKLADGVLRDLENMRLPNYDAARDFSRTLNDYFTRSFASDVSKGTTRGVQQYAPEILVQRAFGAANDLTALRMQDIEGAVGMMRTQYDDAVRRFGAKSAQAEALRPMAELADQNVASIRDAQTRVYRLAAAKAIDPVTGRVDERQLTRFVNENRPMLDRLQITPDLENAARAENVFRGMQAENSRVMKLVNDQAAFSRVVQYENPTNAIASALNSKNPVRNFAGMVRMAQRGGPEAVAGMKASLFDYAFTKAGGETGFSPAAFQKVLFEPLSPGQPSLFSIMRSQNVMSISEGKNLRRLIAPMERIETALKNNQLMDEVIQGGDAVTELALRVIGSKIGGAVSGNNGSLIAQSAGSKYMRTIFDKTPTLFMRGIIEEATKDPQLMAQLLRRGTTEQEKFQMARALHGYMVAAGLNYANFDESQAPQRRPETFFETPLPDFTAPVTGPAQPRIPFRSESQRQLRQLPPAPATRGVPGMPPGAPGAKPPAGQTGQAPMNGSSRAAFQALFPMDTVSSLMVPGQPPQG
jgi:hypothetical protein